MRGDGAARPRAAAPGRTGVARGRSGPLSASDEHAGGGDVENGLYVRRRAHRWTGTTQSLSSGEGEAGRPVRRLPVKRNGLGLTSPFAALGRQCPDALCTGSLACSLTHSLAFLSRLCRCLRRRAHRFVSLPLAHRRTCATTSASQPTPAAEPAAWRAPPRPGRRGSTVGEACSGRRAGAPASARFTGRRARRLDPHHGEGCGRARWPTPESTLRVTSSGPPWLRRISPTARARHGPLARTTSRWLERGPVRGRARAAAPPARPRRAGATGPRWCSSCLRGGPRRDGRERVARPRRAAAAGLDGLRGRRLVRGGCHQQHAVPQREPVHLGRATAGPRWA